MVGELTPVRHARTYVAGIRNLRGRIITVIDLCVRLGLGAVEIGPESRILIADWKGEPVGLLVDRVADAISRRSRRFGTAPPNLHGVQMQKLRGVFRSGERLAALLDLAAVLGSEDRPAKPLLMKKKGDRCEGTGSRRCSPFPAGACGCAGVAPGVEVVGSAANGKIAIQKMRDLRPDLLTLDIEMPEMDGLAVLDALAGTVSRRSRSSW